jgi:hypothetical protein
MTVRRVFVCVGYKLRAHTPGTEIVWKEMRLTDERTGEEVRDAVTTGQRGEMKRHSGEINNDQ